KCEKDKDMFDGSFYGVDGKKRVLNTEKDVKEITEMMSGRKFTVDKVTKRERKRKAAKPFTTSSIQQEAARKLNFRARKTMMVAQQLYEGIDLGKASGGITGLITYMRTDYTRISSTAKQEAKSLIETKYGKEYIGYQGQGKQKEGAQDAHEAIRPTSSKREPKELKDVLSRDQYRL